MSIFTQIVILLMVLACMVMVLLAIRQLTHFEGFEDLEETNHLKDEVEEDGLPPHALHYDWENGIKILKETFYYYVGKD